MKYPNIKEIENADRVTIARWYRSLPSPGTNALGDDNFLEVCNYEAGLMDYINKRFMDMGGMTPEISKIIGPLYR